MSILIDKNTRVLTQGITGKTGQFHTSAGIKYAHGKTCYAAGVTPGKGGQRFEGVPIFNTVAEAKEQTGVNVSVIGDIAHSRVERSTSVSSMRRMKVPPCPRASNQLKSAVRALPT